MIHRILLLEGNLKEIKFESRLIQEVAPCKIDVLRSWQGTFGNLNPFNYDLIIVHDSGSPSSSSPSFSSLEILEQIKRISPSTNTILISANPSIEQAVLAIRMGAEDYLPTPLIEEVFVKALKRGLKIDSQTTSSYHLAYMDDSTGLHNLRYLNQFIDHQISQSQLAEKQFAVLFIDVDEFKQINDQYGHAVGTRLLQEFACQLKKIVRETDTVFRYGGDEFVAILSPCDMLTAASVAERIRKIVESRSFLKDEGRKIQITVSVGVALFPEHGLTRKDLLETADQEMYHAKSTRNKISIAKLTSVISVSRSPVREQEL